MLLKTFVFLASLASEILILKNAGVFQNKTNIEIIGF